MRADPRPHRRCNASRADAVPVTLRRSRMLRRSCTDGNEEPRRPRSASARRSGARRRRRQRRARAAYCRPNASSMSCPPAAAEVAARIEREGGLLIGSYCEPLGRNPLLLAALPIDSVEPTPFQRDLSDAHHKKLSGVIDRTGLFLDPVIAITAPEEGLLDAERPAPARGDAAARREVDHRAGRAEARDRLADPRAQHREGAQPARALARGDPHLQGPDRGGSARGRRATSRSTSRKRRW